MRFLALLAVGIFGILAALAEQVPITASLDTDSEWTAALVQLHQRLVEIESISGNEKAVGEWLANYLDEQGFTVSKQYVSPDRFNVLAYPGTDNKTKILVTSHIDTVSIISRGIATALLTLSRYLLTFPTRLVKMEARFGDVALSMRKRQLLHK
jgi:hypothetical protein